MILRLAIILTSALTLLFLTECGSGCLFPYIAYIDKVEPKIPGLIIKETRGCGGEISIINNTGEDVYLYDERGQEYVKITSFTICRKVAGEWRIEAHSNVYYCLDPRLRYEGPEPKDQKTQIIKHWSIEGRAGETHFTIIGHTVYEPPCRIMKWLRRLIFW